MSSTRFLATFRAGTRVVTQSWAERHALKKSKPSAEKVDEIVVSNRSNMRARIKSLREENARLRLVLAELKGLPERATIRSVEESCLPKPGK